MRRRCINNTYYITFELEDGTQMELWLYKRWYKRLTEGTVGRVTWQGTRFISFEPL